MSRKNIRLEWFGIGNIDDIETLIKLERHFLHLDSKFKESLEHSDYHV